MLAKTCRMVDNLIKWASDPNHLPSNNLKASISIKKKLNMHRLMTCKDPSVQMTFKSDSSIKTSRSFNSRIIKECPNHKCNSCSPLHLGVLIPIASLLMR